jgi:hypothetical protein
LTKLAVFRSTKANESRLDQQAAFVFAKQKFSCIQSKSQTAVIMHQPHHFVTVTAKLF